MDSGLYIVSMVCPVCEKNFDVIKVKTAAVKQDHVDEDFCMHYQGVNPLLYEAVICQHCGYAGFMASFSELSLSDLAALRKKCLNRFMDDPKNPFELTEFHKKVYGYFDSLKSNGERDEHMAAEAFKILLTNLEARNAPSSAKAKALLRTAWVYRFMGDPAETDYLKAALEQYAKAYSEETFPIGKFDYATCAYLIGELHRRSGNPKEAADWFGTVLRMPPDPETSSIVDKARDQLQVVKSAKGV